MPIRFAQAGTGTTSDGNNWDAPSGQYGLADELALLGSMGVIVASAAGNNYGYFGSAAGVQSTSLGLNLGVYMSVGQPGVNGYRTAIGLDGADMGSFRQNRPGIIGVDDMREFWQGFSNRFAGAQFRVLY